MRTNLNDLVSHGSSLAPLVVGAVLATASGVVGNLMEGHARRRERERSAALLFGEVFSTARLLIEGAEASRERGERYGSVTRRMLQAARREMDIYERNREALIDIRTPALRAELHNLAVRLIMPIDGLLDSWLDPAGARDDNRDRAFEFLMHHTRRIPDLVTRLGRVAGHGFDHYDDIPRPGSPLT